jgi:hypothetical protein
MAESDALRTLRAQRRLRAGVARARDSMRHFGGGPPHNASASTGMLPFHWHCPRLCRRIPVSIGNSDEPRYGRPCSGRSKRKALVTNSGRHVPQHVPGNPLDAVPGHSIRSRATGDERSPCSRRAVVCHQRHQARRQTAQSLHLVGSRIGRRAGRRRHASQQAAAAPLGQHA